ncbi:MAG: hypothetical protein K5873_00210 [Treponema sp.]|nr:hypothetical protein [Treponema sp.]
MKIVSWNCRYGLDEKKWNAVKEFCPDADFYLIQETKENDVINCSDFNFRHWYGDHQEFGDCRIPSHNSGDLGIAIFSETYKIERIDEGRERYRYVLPYKVTSIKDNKQFILIHVWTKGFPDYYYISVNHALNYYKKQLQSLNLPIIMIGDFNFGRKIDAEFFVKFDDELERVLGLKKPEEYLKKSNTDTFYYEKNRNYYFNDCMYLSSEWKMIDYKVGERDKWIGKDKSYSDHCPIMAELEFK